MKIFLDTNILMDFLIRTGRPNYEASTHIISEVKNNPEIVAYAAVQSITDCSFYFTKKGVTSSPYFLEPISKLLSFVRLKPNSDQNVYECLINSFSDFEDEMLLRCAIDNDCVYFITADQKILDSQPFPLITAIHPAEFLAKAARQ